MKVQIPFVAREGLCVAIKVAGLAWRTLVYDEVLPDTSSVGVLIPLGFRLSEPKRLTRLTANFPMGMVVSVWLKPYSSHYGLHWEVTKVEARYLRSAVEYGGDKTTTVWEGEALIAIEAEWGAHPPVWRDHPSTRL